MSLITEKQYSKNRFAYIIEAAVEYFISLLVTDAFVTNLFTQNGVSDAATGIIIQLASFAFVAQLFSLFYKRQSKLKVWVTGFHVLNQVVFAALYLIPNISIPSGLKTVIMVTMFLGGHIVSNLIHPYKMAWLMSFVDDRARGVFTANKEIVSLLGGMVFTLVMGNRVDHYMEIEKFDIAFALCGITILVLALAHFISLAVITDHKTESTEDNNTKNGIDFIDTVKSFANNKGYKRAIFAVVIWHIVTGFSVSFFGSYKLNTLGFSLSDAAILSSVSAFTRVIFSRFMGRYADKKSWSELLYLCFIIVSVAFAMNMFVIPGHLKIMFIIYSLIHAISMAGINGGLTNIMFDFVPREQRSAALGVSNSLGGIISFITALFGGWILSSVQNSSADKMLSINVFGNVVRLYGQQVLSCISFVCCLALIFYMKKAILNKNHK